MNAVNEINIGVAGRAKHDLGAFGQTFRGVCSKVMFAEIRFDLDNFPDPRAAAGLVNEPFSEQLPRDNYGVAVIKTAGKFLHSGSVTQFPV